MPLTKSLSDIRHELRDILVEDLPAALTALKELLPENSDLQQQVLALQGRLRDANKERVRNTIEPAEYQRRVDTIRAECLDMIQALTEADFETPTASGGKGASRQGSVLYRIPQQMPVEKPSICTVRVAIDEDAIFEDIVIDDNVKLRQKVEVSDMMTAELIDPEGAIFQIRALSAAEQLVREQGYTQWLFSVTPRIEGRHQLLVKVSMLEYIPQLGRYVPREVSILETVTIVTETPAEPEETPLKPAGHSFAIAPDAEAPGGGRGIEQQEFKLPSEPPQAPYIPEPQAVYEPQPSQRPRVPKTLVFLLAFLAVGGSATFALTPEPTRDWWWASLRNTAESYAAYIEKYGQEENTQQGLVGDNELHQGWGNREKSYLEKAYYYVAKKSGRLEDLRRYQEYYANGRYRQEVIDKVKTLEDNEIKRIREHPDTQKILDFLQRYPDSEQLPVIRETIENRSQWRDELMPALEDAYVRSVQNDPTARKVQDFLRDFPQSTRLADVAEIAASQPEVLQDVRADLEQAMLQRLENISSLNEASELLPAIEITGTEQVKKKAAEIIGRKPAALREQLKNKMKSFQSAVTPRDTTAASGIANNRRSGLEMVLVEGGTFIMGNNSGYADEKPEHSVTLKNFYIGKYEVTQADWREIMGRDYPMVYFKNCDQCPVENVSWNDVVRFVKQLYEKTGKKYRLPNEAEWEYAARGGNLSKKTSYPGGNDLSTLAWYGANAGGNTREVGSKSPNELGLYDMAGNVWEWCRDWYGSYESGAATNPQGVAKGTEKVLRGGSWTHDAERCRVSFRIGNDPDNRLNTVGFRLVRMQ